MNILERNSAISQHIDIMAFGGSAVKDKVKQDPMVFWNNFIRPPLNHYLPDWVIQRLRDFTSSARLMNNPVKRFKLTNELLDPYGFKTLASGTNRRAFYCEYDPQIILKLASDRVGMSDNLRDIKIQNIAKPYVPKICSCATDGILSLIERVEVMTEYDYRVTWANEIFDMVMTFLHRNLIIEDIGANFFKNLGVRLGFGPVFLDAPYMFLIDPRKMKCIKVNPITNQVCGGSIDYNYSKGMSEIICTKCGARYSAKYLAASEELVNLAEINTRRKFDMNTNLKVNVVNTKDGSIVNSYHTESDHQFPVPGMMQPEPQVVQQTRSTVNPNVVVVSNTPEQIAQAQEPTQQIVNNPNVVVVPPEHVESFKQFMAMKEQEEKEKKIVYLFGKSFDADTLYKIAAKFKITEISENSIINLFIAAILNKQTMETLMSDVTPEEATVINELLELATKSIENNTNPAIQNTNAADQVIEEPSKNTQPQQQVVVTVNSDTAVQNQPVSQPQAPIAEVPTPAPAIQEESPAMTAPSPMEIVEFVGVPISKDLKKEITKLLPIIKDLDTDRDIRLYLCRQDVGQFLLMNIKDNILSNELRNFGYALSFKVQEDLVNADLKAKEEATIKKEEKHVEHVKTAKPAINTSRQKVEYYKEYIKNGKTLIFYPKDVKSDIFWMLSKIERKCSLDVANFLANRIGLEYISHDEFNARRQQQQQLHDRPVTAVPASKVVVSQVDTKFDTSLQVPVSQSIDQDSLDKLKKLRDSLPDNQGVAPEKGEVVFQGVTKPVNPDNWKTRQKEEPAKVESQPAANNVVTQPTAAVEEERPTENLFPVKPQLQNEENSAYAKIDTGTAVMGFPGEAKVDTMRISNELPRLQEKVFVRFNNFTPPSDPSEDFGSKLSVAIKEYLEPDMKALLPNNGLGFGVNVVATTDERNKNCYKVTATDNNAQLFSTFIYPIGSQNEVKEKLAAGILYAQNKAIDNFMKENPEEMQIPDEAVKAIQQEAKEEPKETPMIDVNDEKAVIQFFDGKIKEMNLTGTTDVNLSKRFVTAFLQASIIDETKGTISVTKANDLAENFVKVHCNFSVTSKQ